jgi:thiosulfate/3-mercaptopyruvate sulfurtransferase
VAWNWTSQLNDPVRRDIPSKEQLEQLLGQSGISNSDTIVLYGDNNNWFAAFAFWILKIYGHENVKLIDGGRKNGSPMAANSPRRRAAAIRAVSGTRS